MPHQAWTGNPTASSPVKPKHLGTLGCSFQCPPLSLVAHHSGSLCCSLPAPQAHTRVLPAHPLWLPWLLRPGMPPPPALANSCPLSRHSLKHLFFSPPPSIGHSGLPALVAPCTFSPTFLHWALISQGCNYSLLRLWPPRGSEFLEGKACVLLVPVSQASETQSLLSKCGINRGLLSLPVSCTCSLLAEARGNRNAGDEVRGRVCLHGLWASGLQGP